MVVREKPISEKHASAARMMSLLRAADPGCERFRFTCRIEY
jgi:hypothetical protein